MKRELLRRRLESYSNHRSSTLDETVDHLRATYRDYNRIKRQPFTTFVRKTLQSLPPQNNTTTTTTKKKKKRKRILETTSSDENSSRSSSSDEEEDDGAVVSTSEDAPPKFDVMKSNLLASYMELSEAKKVDSNKEVEEYRVEEVKMVVKKGGDGDGNGGPRFRDLGGMDSVIEELKMEVIVPLYHPQLPQWLGVKPMGGILLRGPPGCGKTKLAHAIANETGVPFYKISATEIVTGVSGLSCAETNVLKPRLVYIAKAKMDTGAFCLVDALATKRGKEGGWVVERLLNQLLIELDGAEQRRGVFVIGATNRPGVMDRAILRPGRFGKLLYVPLPSPDERGLILKALGRKKPIDASVDLSALGRMEACENFSGADLAALMNEAAMVALEDKLTSTKSTSDAAPCTIKSTHFERALATNRPDAVDPALRRPGRFDREIVLGVPDESARVKILSVITRNLRLEGSFNLLKIARSTPGFVGADLTALANKAGNLAMKRIIDERKSELSKDSINEEHTEEWWRQSWSPEEMEKLTITMADFEEAVKMVQPSSKREGFSTIPNVKWEDVGGLDFLRKEFDRYIVRRIKYPEDYEKQYLRRRKHNQDSRDKINFKAQAPRTRF
ncbi:cell division control protein 48 like protein c [Quercus suber]|uniref:Cell division control protein 48 like protein c n=1 Tax=Quercus suber TaxID=58331 RepID=A0AAW0KSG1_QUESU